MFACRAAQGTKFPTLAVENSGWKLKFVGAQVFGLALWYPFFALATMKPDCPVVRSSMRDITPPSKTPGTSIIVMRNRSPWFISRVCSLGVKLASVKLAYPAGPVGMPFRWINAKFVGSGQFSFKCPSVTSSVLMWGDAHQCFRSQLIWVMKGEKPGG